MNLELPEKPFTETGVPTPEHLTSDQETVLGRRLLFWFGLVVGSVFVGLALVRVDPILVFAGLFGILAGAVVLHHPWVGLLVYTAVFMVRPAELYPALAPLRLEMVVGCITLAGLAFQQYRRDGQLLFDRSRQSTLLLLFITAAALSTPTSYWRSNSIDGVMTLLKILAFYAMLVHLVDTRVRVRVFTAVLIVLQVYVIASSLGTIRVAQGIERVTGLTSAAGSPNEIGATVAATFPFLFLMSLYKPLRGGRYLLLASCAVLVYALSLTGSRAGVLGFLAGLSCLWWMSPRRVLFGFVGALALLVTFSILPEQYKARYATIASSQLDSSSRGRLESWKDGMTMVIDRPLVGVGINSFQAAHDIRDGWSLDAHSMYVQVLAEVGLLGAIPFFGFLIQMLILNRRAMRSLASEPDWQFERVVLQGVFIGLVALMVTATFGTQYIKRLWYIYGALQLVIWRLHLDSKSTPEELTIETISPH